MKDKIVIFDDIYGLYRLGWFLGEEQDMGATLGDGPNINTEPDRSIYTDEWEFYTANKVAALSGAERDGDGFYWDSQKEARKVLKIIKETFKSTKPLADWEKQALEAGWKPPKTKK